MGSISVSIDLWQLIVGVVLLVAWFVRLESKVLYLERDHGIHQAATNKQKEDVWQKMNEVVKTMQDILIAVGRLEGKLDGKSADRSV